MLSVNSNSLKCIDNYLKSSSWVNPNQTWNKASLGKGNYLFVQMKNHVLHEGNLERQKHWTLKNNLLKNASWNKGNQVGSNIEPCTFPMDNKN